MEIKGTVTNKVPSHFLKLCLSDGACAKITKKSPLQTRAHSQTYNLS